MTTTNRTSWESTAGAGNGPALVGGIAIGALLLGLVWASVVVVTGSWGERGTSGSSSAPAGAPPAASPPPAGGSTDADTTTRRDRCADEAQTLEGPVVAAEPAMDQWSLHVAP